MYTLFVGYINGNIHHAYVKDIHGESHGIDLTVATCLFREKILSGHEMHHMVLNESNELDWIEF